MITRKISLTVLSFSVMVMLISYVYASERVNTNNSLDELKTYVESSNLEITNTDAEQQQIENEWKESLKQAALLNHKIERLNFTKSQFAKKKANQLAVQKYALQLDYYNICLFIKQLELLQSQLAVVHLQIKVEETKLKNGLSTQLNVDELNNQKQGIQSRVEQTNSSIAMNKSNLKAKLNEATTTAFDPSFTIPSLLTDTTSFSLQSLKDNLSGNILELTEIKANISAQTNLISKLRTILHENDSYLLSAKSDLNKLQVGESLLKQKINLYIEQKYNSYSDATSSYITLVATKTIAAQKLVVLATKHQTGAISDLEYEIGKYENTKQQVDVYKAIVTQLNAKSVVDLANQGVLLN